METTNRKNGRFKNFKEASDIETQENRGERGVKPEQAARRNP